MSIMIEKAPRGYLKVHDLRKDYGAYAAIRNIDLDIPSGELVALLGPSGCGKTTLLRCIAGLVKPSSGKILIDANSILQIPVNRRGLGMVFQSYALFPHMTVAQNIAFGLRMRKLPKLQTTRQVAEILNLVQLEDFAERYPNQLSGGQQQRVALARALVIKPKVLLLDEPLGALDANLRESMQVELRQLQQQLGLTTILVTHDQQEALAMADRIAVMRAGVIEQFDTPRVIYDRPASAFVASFIGEMNRVRVRVAKRWVGGVHLQAGPEGGILIAEECNGLAEGEYGLAMVRPEKMLLCDAEIEDGTYVNKTDGILIGVMFRGDRILCIVDTPLGQMTTVRQSGTNSPDIDLTIGRKVSVAWRAKDTHVFHDA